MYAFMCILYYGVKHVPDTSNTKSLSRQLQTSFENTVNFLFYLFQNLQFGIVLCKIQSNYTGFLGSINVT